MSIFVKEYRALDQDIELSANSDYRVASQKAIKTYVDKEVDHVKGAIDWRLQNFTVTEESNTLTIPLEKPCYFKEGMFALYQGKTVIPTELLTVSSDKKTLTITSSSNFEIGDIIQLRWAYLNTQITVDGYVQLPQDVTNDSVDIVIEHGTLNGVWYRLYKSGWLEQGGTQTGTGVYGLSEITLAKEYLNAEYFVNAQIQWNSENNMDWYTNDSSITSGAGVSDVTGIPCDKTTTGFKLQSFSTHVWTTKGQVKV